MQQGLHLMELRMRHASSRLALTSPDNVVSFSAASYPELYWSQVKRTCGQMRSFRCFDTPITGADLHITVSLLVLHTSGTPCLVVSKITFGWLGRPSYRPVLACERKIRNIIPKFSQYVRQPSITENENRSHFLHNHRKLRSLDCPSRISGVRRN